MLVIANGAFKSGSTWQRGLIRGILDFEPRLPESIKSKKYGSFIDHHRLPEIVRSPEIKKLHYIAKAHIFKKKQIDYLISNTEDVKVFMIQRDIRDAIVSHYNHFRNVRRFKPSFRTYYWLIGRYKAMQILKYNMNWKSHHTNVFHSTFETLKSDTSGEIKRFASFLGVDISESKIKEIIEANSMKKAREKSERKWFFRKGEIGDYKNYLTPAIEKDLARLEKKLSAFDALVYYLLFELRYVLS